VRIVLGLIAVATSVAFAAGQDSTVLGVSAKPNTVRAASPVTATATGKGLCGAVHIDWGDGTAITYPTSTLPVSQSHSYQYGGSYTIRAQGMGNCSGQATTTIRVEGPPPPAAPAPPAPPAAPPAPAKGASIVSVDVSTPGDAEQPSMRAIRVAGTGTCAYKLDFGDGNSEGRNAPLPDVVRHNYPAPGRYRVVATASAPCAGSARSSVVVGDSDPDAGRVRGRVSAVDVATDARTDTPVVINLQGSGYCKVTVDFDDERQREITATLPARVTHRFENRGDYQIVAWAHSPCTGGGSADLRVR
jgi:hypothetical protein